MTTNDYRSQFFEKLSQARGRPSEGGDPIVFLEKLNNVMVPVQFYEPDARTSHTEHYYNARQNVLYKRKIINDNEAVWQPIRTM